MSFCAACKQVTGELAIKCSKSKCDKVYDLLCIGINKEDFVTFSSEYKNQWICPECVQLNPKRLSNDTPILISEQKRKSSSSASSAKTQQSTSNLQKNHSLKTREGTLISDFKEFRAEVLNRLDIQDRNISDIQKICRTNHDSIQQLKDTINNMIHGNMSSIERELKKISERDQRVDLLLSKVQSYRDVVVNDDKNRHSTLLPVQYWHDKTIRSTTEQQITAGLPTSIVELSSPRVATKSVTTMIEGIGNESLSSKECHGLPGAATKSANLTDQVQCESIVMMDETFSPQDSHESPEGNKNEWITVRNKSARNNVAKAFKVPLSNDRANENGALLRNNIPQIKKVQRGQNTTFTNIKAVEQQKHLHVWRLTLDTTVENVTEHVKSICGSEIMPKVVKIQHKTVRSYASFIITVPEDAYDALSQPDAWPVNAAYAEWIWFRKSKSKYIAKV